ncbi:hypothetical protein DH2020_018200 [Rehmannia glutinosa]|uniref:Uncharacterized protein n=1 Tax=Rehmannia glutinosa TaxID=99300 RepID=A0ABR0WK78_REHGL
MNEMPSPKMSESDLEVMKGQQKKNGSKMVFKREKMQSGWGLHSGSGFLPPHLSDPSHSPTVSEKVDRSGTGSRRKGTPSISQRLMSADQNVGVIDSISNASLMENKDRIKRDQPSHEVFCEEKASWKNKEHQAVETAIGSIVGELEAERKLRRRLESLNKKLGQELAEMKSAFVKSVKELESEKRAREITEEVCDELARNIDEDRAEVEKEREMLELADKLREERVQMKLSEAKHQFEEKNSAVSKLRKQLEVFLRTKRDKDDEEAEDAIDGKEDSAESDLHSIELNTDNNNKGYKWKLPAINEIKARNSVSGQVSRRSVSLQRSTSDGVELETEASRSSYFDETQRLKAVKGLKDHHVLPPSSRLALAAGDNHSPSRKKEQSWPSRDPFGTVGDRSPVIQTTSSKSRTGVVRGEGQSTRRSKW